MKDLRKMMLTLALIALGSTSLEAMDHAPVLVISDDRGDILDAKNAVEAQLAGCRDSCKLSLSLQELLQTYSVDVLVAPLKDYFRSSPGLVCKQDDFWVQGLSCSQRCILL